MLHWSTQKALVMPSEATQKNKIFFFLFQRTAFQGQEDNDYFFSRNSKPGSFSYQLCEFEPLFPHSELMIIHCGSILYVLN